MRVFSLVLMTSSALQSRASSTFKVAGLETSALHDSDVADPPTDHRRSTPSKRLFGSDDPTKEMEERTLKWLAEELPWLANKMTRDPDEQYLITRIRDLRKEHPEYSVYSLLLESPEWEHLENKFLNGRNALLLDLRSAKPSVRLSGFVVLMQRSEDSVVEAFGTALMEELMIKWENVEPSDMFEELGMGIHSIFGLTDLGRLSDDVLKIYCRHRVEEYADELYINILKNNFGGSANLNELLRKAYQIPSDRGRATELIDTLLKIKRSNFMKPHQAFEEVGLDKYGTSLFDDNLLSLLNEYVVIYELYTKQITTLVKELSLLQGFNGRYHAIEKRIGDWKNIVSSRKTPEYIVEQHFHDWLDGGVTLDMFNEHTTELRDKYDAFLKSLPH